MLLSATMVFSTVAGFAACKETADDNDTGNTTTEADLSRIQNGSFEFFEDNGPDNAQWQEHRHIADDIQQSHQQIGIVE